MYLQTSSPYLQFLFQFCNVSTATGILTNAHDLSSELPPRQQVGVVFKDAHKDHWRPGEFVQTQTGDELVHGCSAATPCEYDHILVSITM